MNKKMFFAFALLVFSVIGCNSGNSQTSSSVVGSWSIYGASTTPSGEIITNSDLQIGTLTLRSDGSFSQNQIWDGAGGTWSQTGNTVRLSFSNGSSRSLTISDGRMYTQMSGIYYWLR